jgi:hypothetical protein
MANRRMLASDTWRDEFIGSLDLFGRLLWVGMITTCADDQGRVLYNPRLIRTDIFPFDDFSVEQVERTITLFADAGKISIYEADGKKLIQIVNWWEYQTPAWASPSKYKAPDNWTDREKYHSVGNKIVLRNWDTVGGFTSLHSDYIAHRGEDVKGKGNVNGDSEGDSELPPPTFDKPELAIIHEVTGGLIPDFTNEPRVINNVQACRGRMKNPPVDLLKVEIRSTFDYWCSLKTKEGKAYNPNNWPWTDWLVTGYRPEPNGQGVPAPNGKPKSRAELNIEALQKLKEDHAHGLV